MSDKETNLINLANKENKTLLERYKIPLENLSYEYIAGCTNSTTLEHIVTILRSGEEGIYPELTKYAEERLRIIKPTSLILSKASAVLTRQMLNKEEQNVINDFMKNWTDEMRCKEKMLNDEKTNLITDSSLVPNIRSDCQNNLKECTNTYYDGNRKSKRITSCDYAAWDKYDVDTEINRIDLQEERQLILAKEMQREQNEREKKINEPLDIKEFMKHQLTYEEVNMIVDQEIIKGNEFYRIGDYDTALKYYDFCFSANSSSQALSNRATTYYKLQRYEDAINDDNILILENNQNFGSLCRRGLCFLNLEKLNEAVADFKRALEIKPDCTEIKCKYEKLKNRIELEKSKNKNEEITSSDSSAKVIDPSVVPNNKQENINLVNNEENKIQTKKIQGRQHEITQTTTKSFNKYYKLNRYEDASEDDNILISENNKYITALNRRALSFIHLRKLEEAIPDLKSILKLRPNLSGIKCKIEELKNNIESLKLKNQNEEGTLLDSNAKVTDPSLVPNNKQENVNLVDNKENKIQTEKMEERQNEIEQTTTKSFDINEYKNKFSSAAINSIVKEVRSKANKCLLKGDYNDALKYLNFCIELKSSRRDMKYRAMAYLRMERYEDAINDFNILHRENSDNPDFMFRRCFCLIKLGKLEEAAIFLKSCLKLKPDCLEIVPQFKKLQEYIKLRLPINKSTEGTLPDSNAKVTDPSLVPNNKQENVNLVDNKENKIQTKKVEERQNEIKQTTTKHLGKKNYKSKCSSEEIDQITDEIIFQGDQCYLRNDYDGALEHYSFCVDLNLCPRALNCRAALYFALSRYEDALKDYDILISQDNKDAVSMYRRCYCLIKLEKLEEAADGLYKAWQLMSDYEESFSVFQEIKSYIELVKVRFDTKEETLLDSIRKTDVDKIYNEQLDSYYQNLLTISNSKLKSFGDNANICYCERGPGPSYSTIPFPHIKEDYCIQNESNMILHSSSETYFKPKNINMTLSDKIMSNEASILNSQKSKNNKRNKQKSILSCSTANISKVDTKKTLDDQSHTTKPNIIVKLDNKRVNNNNNNYNVNENEYKSLPKRICIDNNYDDDQMYQKQNDTFKDVILCPHKFNYLWQTFEDTDHNLQLRAKLLRSIKLDNIGTGDKLDGFMLRIILRCLGKYFCVPEDCELIVCYLKSISLLNRFLLAKKFLCTNDKRVLSNIFKFLEDQGRKEVSLLREIYK
ncbi:hypothetical protein M0804_004180 [Polistes exclamans]|nr:hypothetical protein M0804_004180 [Polistes exclamans]